MRQQRTIALYSFAALAAAVLLRWLLDPYLRDYLPFVTFMGAIAVAVWHGGWRPAAIVALLGWVIGSFLFVDPRGSLAFGDPRNALRLVGYLTTAAIVIGFGEALHASHRRLEELAARLGGAPPGSSAAPAPGTMPHAPATRPPRDLAVPAFGLTLLVLLVGGSLGYLNLRRLADNQLKETHTLAVQRELFLLQTRLTDAETGQRGYLLTEDPQYLEPYDNAVSQIDAGLARLGLLVAEDFAQRARLAEIAERVERKREEMQRTIDLVREGDHEGALRTLRSDAGQAIMTDLRRAIGGMRGAEDTLMRQRTAESEASARTTGLLLGVTTVLGILMVCVALQFSRQSLRLQRRGADLIAEERERLRVTLASIGDAVIVTGVDGRVLSLNAVAEALTGWTQAETAGQPLETVFHVVDERTRERVETTARRAIRDGVIVGLESHSVLVRKDGSERPIDDSASPIRDARGTVVGCVLVFRDITERRRVERRMHDLLRELQEGDRRKDQFLAMLAHELRSPLAPLRDMLEVMKRARGDLPTIEAALPTMDRQLKHLVRLVDELIDVSRITRDTIELRRATVALEDVVGQVVEACRPMVEAAQQRVSVTLPVPPIRLHADPVRLAQVFGNLLANASKYTGPGGSIALSAERRGDDVVVRVTDTGIGIPREELRRVFEMFTQLDQSLERSQGGLGIGLTLVKRLVALHDGTVEAKSDGPGKGSEFVVRLPALPASLRADAATPAGDAATPPPATGSLGSLRTG